MPRLQRSAAREAALEPHDGSWAVTRVQPDAAAPPATARTQVQAAALAASEDMARLRAKLSAFYTKHHPRLAASGSTLWIDSMLLHVEQKGLEWLNNREFSAVRSPGCSTHIRVVQLPPIDAAVANCHLSSRPRQSTRTRDKHN